MLTLQALLIKFLLLKSKATKTIGHKDYLDTYLLNRAVDNLHNKTFLSINTRILNQRTNYPSTYPTHLFFCNKLMQILCWVGL